MGRPATDKKDRLVDAAMLRFHRDGVVSASLAVVANDAGVPPGNVFYYFRSKDALATAVIDRWCDRVEDHLAEFETRSDPLQRIGDFLRSADGRRQNYADFGCPLAALRNDLRHGPGALAMASGRPLAIIRAWSARQFALGTGTKRQAERYADFCLASLQGSYALAHASGDPLIVSRTVEQLLEWIDQLPRAARMAAPDN